MFVGRNMGESYFPVLNSWCPLSWWEGTNGFSAHWDETTEQVGHKAQTCLRSPCMLGHENNGVSNRNNESGPICRELWIRVRRVRTEWEDSVILSPVNIQPLDLPGLLSWIGPAIPVERKYASGGRKEYYGGTCCACGQTSHSLGSLVVALCSWVYRGTQLWIIVTCARRKKKLGEVC